MFDFEKETGATISPFEVSIYIYIYIYILLACVVGTTISKIFVLII